MLSLKSGEIMKSNVLLTIVIPCFNESESIPEILKQSKKIAEEGWCSFVIVDNGSTDQTTSKLFNVSDPLIQVVRTENNLGYGGGILYGLSFARTPFIGWMHADLQTPILELKNCKELINQYDFVKGVRIDRKFIDKVFSSGMALIESVLFFNHLFEINAQPTMFRKELLDSWERAPTDFSLDLFAMITAKRLNMRFGRFTVPFYPRKHGKSTWNHGIKSRIRFIVRTLHFSFKLRFQS